MQVMRKGNYVGAGVKQDTSNPAIARRPKPGAREDRRRAELR
jgi:hypothetical protein